MGRTWVDMLITNGYMKRYMISKIVKEVQITHLLGNNKHQSVLSVSNIIDQREFYVFSASISQHSNYREKAALQDPL